jgi:hypothetical protein
VQASDGRVAPLIGLGEDDPKIRRTLSGSAGVFLVEFGVAVEYRRLARRIGDGITVLSVAAAKEA